MIIALAVGVGVWWFQTRHYYEAIPASAAEVRLTSLVSGRPEAILADGVEAIDATSSPIRYRACFTTPMSVALLTESYRPYADAEPLTGPGWFSCYDASEVGEALEDGRALAFLGEANVVFGIDRVVAIGQDGRGYVWHQINECGREVFEGRAAPDGCPARPAPGD